MKSQPVKSSHRRQRICALPAKAGHFIGCDFVSHYTPENICPTTQMHKFLLALTLLCCGVSAHASALLKPTTGATQALRAKNLDIKADIQGAFARATVTTVYANPNNGQIEADFIYTAPPGATVTGFAYWFKGEKVVARVVEKERAAEIYTLITVQRRDPALVEMIGKNTFRARIAPVEARADLKIEVQYVEPLAATKDGWRWTFPLKQDTKNYPLDAVNLSAKVAGAGVATSNFGEFRGGDLSAKKTEVKDTDDVQIDLAAPRAPLKVSLFAARDSGSDGFFALALSPDFSATKPSFAVSGIQTYDVMRDPNARAGQTFVAVGRYRGAGEALVKLGNRSVKVSFPEATLAGNIAAQMWGARRIETLSENDSNRAAVINLSMRFGMPSKWTSWLALPASEKKAFERQLLNLEISRAVSRWAQSVALNDTKRAAILRQRAYDYRARLNKLDGRSGNLSVDVFRQALNNELDRVMRAGYEKSPDKAKLAKLARNLRGRGAMSEREIAARLAREDQQKQKRQQQALERAEALRPQFLSALERGDKTQARLLEKRVDAALKGEINDYNPRNYWLWDRMTQIATAIWRERKAGIEDSPRQQELLLKLQRLLPESPYKEKEVLEQGQTAVYEPDLRAAYQQFSEEIKAGREDSARAQEANARINQLRPLTPKVAENDEWPVRYESHFLALKLARDYAKLVDQGAPTTQTAPILERAKRNFERGRDAYGIGFETLVSYGWHNVLTQANRALADEIVAKRENSPAAQQARARRQRALENGGRDDYYSGNYAFTRAWKGRAHETAYRIIEAKQNGDAKTAKALQAQLQVEVENAGELPLDAYIEWEKSRIKRGEPVITSEQYVLRPGDPLISVSAPADCQKVVAILPSGELLPLVYDPLKKAWEARFDVPTYAQEGDYKVKIIIVAADGTRHLLTMTFHVDVTAPDGKGGVHFGADTVKLSLQTDEQTDRVSAFVPWGARVELRRDSEGVFGATAPVPAEWRGQAAVVRFVLTDKAHNRTEIAVDWNR